MISIKDWMARTLCVTSVVCASYGLVAPADAFPLFRSGNGSPPPGTLPRNALRLNNLYDPIDARFSFVDVSVEIGFDGSPSEGLENPDPFDATSISIFGDVFGGGVAADTFDSANSASWFLDFTFDSGIGFNDDDPFNPFWFVNSPNAASDPGSGAGILKLTSFGTDFDASPDDDETLCTADTCQLNIVVDPNVPAGDFAFQYFPEVNFALSSTDKGTESQSAFDFGDTGTALGRLCHGGNYGVDPLLPPDDESIASFCARHPGEFSIGAVAVPEPAPVALLGAGLSMLLWGWGRRSR